MSSVRPQTQSSYCVQKPSCVHTCHHRQRGRETSQTPRPALPRALALGPLNSDARSSREPGHKGRNCLSALRQKRFGEQMGGGSPGGTARWRLEGKRSSQCRQERQGTSCVAEARQLAGQKKCFRMSFGPETRPRQGKLLRLPCKYKVLYKY